MNTCIWNICFLAFIEPLPLLSIFYVPSKGSRKNIMVFIRRASITSIVICAYQVLALSGGQQRSSRTPALIGRQSNFNVPVSRRDSIRQVFGGSVATVAAGGIIASAAAPDLASAATSEADSVAGTGEMVDVYFGCGCFWHVQHEFVEAERKILQRTDASLTSRAGYAGGRAKDDLVCYHNARSIGDYGSLGHAEVVSLTIPATKFQDFAEEYFKLFDKDGNRPDQFGDRGPEYRNLVGVPGGVTSTYAKQLVAASVATGDKLDFAVGKGDDRDARALAFVMDTAQYPFYIGEQYHQFHDGFNLNENYPNSYNSLASDMAKSGSLLKNMCPNGALGLGVAGL